MDAVFFSLKRGFHATLRCSRPLLARVGLTPARFDVLYALGRSDGPRTQSALRRMLGLARATISEMLAALEHLGWVQRRRDHDDRRTHRVALTDDGRAALEHAYAACVASGVVPLAVDSALSRGDAEVDPFASHDQLHFLCKLVRRFFGETAIAELYPWHPDEYLGGLLEVGRGFRLLPVDPDELC